MTFTGIPVAALDFYEDLEADNTRSSRPRDLHSAKEKLKHRYRRINRWQKVAARLLVVGLVAASASCNGSAKRNATVPATKEMTTSTLDKAPTTPGPDANTACRLITAHVVALAVFPVHVAKIEAQSRTEAGLSVCTYGDEPDPKLLSLSALILIETTPSYLRARHLPARDAAVLDPKSCVAGTTRKLDPRDGLGMFAFFCVSKTGSMRGAWILRGAAYNLSYYSPADARRAVTDRLDRIDAVARAISANVPR